MSDVSRPANMFLRPTWTAVRQINLGSKSSSTAQTHEQGSVDGLRNDKPRLLKLQASKSISGNPIAFKGEITRGRRSMRGDLPCLVWSRTRVPAHCDEIGSWEGFVGKIPCLLD